MKSAVSLILSFFLCVLCYAQEKHISDFTSLSADGQNSDFILPSTHTFQYIIQHEDPLDVGGTMPDVLDFSGYVPRNGSSKYGFLSINSEAVPGAVTILDIEFNDKEGKWFIDSSEAVEFDFNLPFGSTVANCSGTVTPWNTIITCEEVTNKDIKVGYPFIPDSWIKVDGDPNGYDGYGWAIEIDPATKKVIDQEGDRDLQDKLWAMGNFKHENAVVHSNLRTVYQGADDYLYDEGFLYKFVADTPKVLSSGVLYVYQETSSTTGRWLVVPNTSIEERNSTLAYCHSVEATSFDGIEDVEINPIDGTILFAVKGDGKVYEFTDSDPIDGLSVTDFKTYVGGMSYEIESGVTEPWGTGNDNLVFDDLGNLWVAQDGDENYIWVVENGHTQSNPKVKIFARTPSGSEPTGLTFTPDYKYIFMSIQHPSTTNSSTNQTDASGKSVAFDRDITLVIGRNEHLGKDLTSDDQDIMISQYYHDEASDSKWIEIKNISGKDIPLGTYFIDLYDSADLVNIATIEPKASDSIPAMIKDEVLLFKNSQSPASPLAAHVGDADQIVSSIADFEGNDVILITTTPGTRKYINRKDIIGNITPTQWGQNNSLTRGGNSSEIPERDFEANNWIELDPILEVNEADKFKNIALGTHIVGPAIWNGASWDNESPPDRTRNIDINGEYKGGQEDFVAYYDLKINDGGSLNFEEKDFNNNLIVHRDLTIHSNGSLVIGDTESLIITNAAAIVTGAIEKIENSFFRNHAEDITFWSSPVEGEQVDAVFTKVDQNRVFYFDQSVPVNDWVIAKGTMITGKGYAAEGPLGETGEHKIRFKGRPNFGTITLEDIVFNNDEGNNENELNDWNLIGNPYPAAIDIELFLEFNRANDLIIDGTAYLWTHATEIGSDGYSPSDYVTYNLTGPVSIEEDVVVTNNIGSGQGFFVRATAEGDVIFDKSMILEGSNDQFFKGTKKKGSVEKNRLWLNLKGSDNSFKQILIGFDEKATDQMDSGYDALYLNGNQSIAFYSVLDDRKLAIQGLGSFNDQKLINLGFVAEMEGLEMNIELSRKEGLLIDQDILLLDNDNGIVHDLNLSPYIFSYEGKGVFQDRFSLLFNSAVLGLDEDTIAQDVKVYMKDQNLIIDAQDLIEQIKVYDALGRLVHKEQTQADYFELNLDRIKMGGFFIVELVDAEGKTLTRKMIKY